MKPSDDYGGCSPTKYVRADKVSELEAMLLFLVENDSINDSSIEKEVTKLLNAK